MKFLLRVMCRPEELKQRIEDKMSELYGVVLQLGFIGTLPLSGGKVLIVYEFKKKGDDCEGNLFAVEWRGVDEEIKEYWVYSLLAAKVCKFCGATLEEWMSRCPRCGGRGVWRIC